ncbi:heavy metal translocating P-type ATPase [Xylaria arbuscula]|nr:heavy metal translocating P-type ATPase [Xylaria arbuscula]
MAPVLPSHPFVTTFLVANIHCPTCVSSIKDALQDLDGVRWVSPNIITSCVAVDHDPRIPIMHLVNKLEAAGFEVSSLSSENGVGCPENPFLENAEPPLTSRFCAAENCLPGFRRRTPSDGSGATKEERAKAHLTSCEQCRVDTKNGIPATPTVTSDTSRQRPSPGTNKKSSALSAITPTHTSSVVSDDASTTKSWRASLAISGMTCASCVNAIKSELEKKDWVTEATINLVSNSAVVEYVGNKEDVAHVIESIEDLGYDAHLDQISAVDDEREKEVLHQRTVQIHIDGFYCPHCGDRVAASVSGFQQDIRIDSRPTWQCPILEITYVPQTPTFTVRQILAAIEASDPAFKASIYHPPTLEERAKKIQAQHQRQILLRTALTLVIAVPTFIIGIVYMSLLPEHDSGRHFLMQPWVSGINRAQIALFVLATPVYFFTADIFHRRTIKEIWSLWRPGSQTPVLRRLYRFGSMNMLISLGTTIAYVSSVAQMIAAGAKNLHMVEDSDFYFDSVVFLTLFLLAGRFLEAYSKSKTGNAVEALGKLRPTTAILVEQRKDQSTSDQIVGTDMLEFGDTVRVPHGSSPPCDGEVLQGNTIFDEASLTGESRPIKKTPGDQVFSGTVNEGTPILIRITGTAGQSMLDKIVKVVREGQTKRAPMEKVADALVAYFVPVITLIAILTWIIWLVIGITDNNLGIRDPVPFSLQFAISVFVVACPCGLALAAPTAIFVGGGLAAKYGILVKGGGEAFETASRIDCVVFDKTGTLTVGGEPSVTDAETYLNENEDPEGKARARLFNALRAVEENSSHPVAKAIVNYCKSIPSVSPISVSEVEEIPGRGLKATCSSSNGGDTPDESFQIIVGNEALMHDFAVHIPPAANTSLHTWKTEAKSVALVAITKPVPSNPSSPSEADTAADTTEYTYTLAAALSISDTIRPETPAVIRAIRQRGCAVWMLSGDNVTTARAVALSVGIPADNVIAEVLPTQKSEKIKYLQTVLKARVGSSSSNGRWRRRRRGTIESETEGEEAGEQENVTRRATIAMVGDGINDAPALSTADVGIAIGSGSDVAISSADFVLVNSHLSAVVTLLSLSRTVFRRIKFNFAWALVYNLVAIPIAAGCLYAVTVKGRHVTLDPVWASLAMALSSFSVVMSSLALKTRVYGIGFRGPRDGGG